MRAISTTTPSEWVYPNPPQLVHFQHNPNPEQKQVDFVVLTADALVSGAVEMPGGGVPPGPRLHLSLFSNPSAHDLRFRVELLASRPTGEAMHWAVYDPLGRRVSAGLAPADADGFYYASWSGSRFDGVRTNPGVYYLEVRIGHLFARETVVRLAN